MKKKNSAAKQLSRGLCFLESVIFHLGLATQLAFGFLFGSRLSRCECISVNPR